MFQGVGFLERDYQLVALLDSFPVLPVLAPVAAVIGKPLVRATGAFAAVGAGGHRDQVVRVVGKLSAQPLVPLIAAVTMGMAQGDEVIHVQVAGQGKGVVGIRVVPTARGHRALVRIGERHGNLTGGDQHFCPGVLAIPVSINPVGPAVTVVEGAKSALGLAGILLGLLLLLVECEAGLAMAVVIAGAVVGMATLFVETAGVRVKGARDSQCKEGQERKRA